MPSQPLTDTHVHFWHPRQLRYSWLDGNATLNRPFLPGDYQAATSALNVRKIVFVECGVDPSQSRDEVQWVTQLASREPRLGGLVVHAALEQGGGIRNDLAALATNPLVKGVRRLLQGEADTGFCLRSDFVLGVRQLAAFRFTCDLCVRHEQLPAATELVCRCPEVTFVLDHLGKPPVRDRALDPWRHHLASLAKLPNVACKISGLTTEADWQQWRPADLRPYLDHALACFGFERVLFGSDWPVATLATTCERWFETVQDAVASASASDRARLFQSNAERIYRV